jgi:hypothetical protein
MIRVSFTIDDDVIAAIAETARTAPSKVRRMVGDVARGPIANAMIQELSREPGPARKTGRGKKGQSVLRWKSERQRRAYFASNGFGGGIPYRRNHRVARGWRVVVISAARAEIAVENSERAARFVEGDDAQPMHLATGWPQSAPIIQRFREPFEDALINGWYRICGAAK